MSAPDWSGIVANRQIAAAELAALETLDGEAGAVGAHLVAGDPGDNPPAAGEEASWLDRQLAKLQALKSQAESKLRDLGDAAKGGVRKAAKSIQRSARQGLAAARATIEPSEPIGEKVKRGFKALLTWAAAYAGGGIVLNIGLLYLAYKLLSDDRVQGAAKTYYSRR